MQPWELLFLAVALRHNSRTEKVQSQSLRRRQHEQQRSQLAEHAEVPRLSFDANDMHEQRVLLGRRVLQCETDRMEDGESVMEDKRHERPQWHLPRSAWLR